MGLPADAKSPQLTGHTTGTANNTGLILESDLVMVTVPGIYNLSFTLTDFPSVCARASLTNSFCASLWASLRINLFGHASLLAHDQAQLLAVCGCEFQEPSWQLEISSIPVMIDHVTS